MGFSVYVKKKVTINTDPQRRCYNGAHFKSEEVWTNWGLICNYSRQDDAEDTMKTFQAINKDHQYKIVEESREQAYG